MCFYVDRSKDGIVIKPTQDIEIIEDNEKEIYRLKFRSAKVVDDGTYTITAKNAEGTTTQQAKLIVNSEYIFIGF
jgi:hypothetical protein